MAKHLLKDKCVLITGGTSGLGRSIAIQMSQITKKVYVIGMSRGMDENSSIEFLKCDFTDLRSVENVCKMITSKKLEFDVLINNAGILSPPEYTITSDGFEKSYQVNFLSHVLLTRLLLINGVLSSPIVINTSSPVYMKGSLEFSNDSGNTYTVLQAYANSKLYQALFSEKLAEEGIRGFAFNPGTFSSGIFRSQKAWFQKMYRIAAPFMVSADRVASRLLKILENDQFLNGRIISKNGTEKAINKFEPVQKKQFWDKINAQLNRYDLG